MINHIADLLDCLPESINQIEPSLCELRYSSVNELCKDYAKLSRYYLLFTEQEEDAYYLRISPYSWAYRRLHTRIQTYIRYYNRRIAFSKRVAIAGIGFGCHCNRRHGALSRVIFKKGE